MIMGFICATTNTNNIMKSIKQLYLKKNNKDMNNLQQFKKNCKINIEMKNNHKSFNQMKIIIFNIVLLNIFHKINNYFKCIKKMILNKC